MKIILIGFMGSGKSSVARVLGHLLELPALEMDELVCQKANAKNMHDVFAQGGELLLRETEIAIARECAGTQQVVIATGGGVIHNKIVLDYLKTGSGRVFYLDVGFQVLVDRLTGDTSRPLFKDLVQAESLYHFRRPIYLRYADQVIEISNKSVEEVAREIAEEALALSE